ncbi:MAG: hypothetical protein ACRDZ3_13110 [Acidimicrobiia bacterium]
MRAPAEWEIVGGDPAPGDPTAFEVLAGFFADTAADAAEVEGRLRRLAEGTDDSIWQGEAADAFREEIGKLPGPLENSTGATSRPRRPCGSTG